jgi:hypothetical protein
MRNYIVLPRCTVQLAHGEFCDADAAEDMPFPICERHADQLYKHMRPPRQHVEEVRDQLRQERLRERPPEEVLQRQARRDQASADQSVVYYVRLPGDRIKIGTTVNMKLRLTGLRVRSDAVLATEPGSYDLERMRHKQFADLRFTNGMPGVDLEDFEPGQVLLDHIAMLRKHFGDPQITTYPKVS